MNKQLSRYTEDAMLSVNIPPLLWEEYQNPAILSVVLTQRSGIAESYLIKPLDYRRNL